MKTLLIDLTEQLPRGLVELYSEINKIMRELNIEYLIVGAMARDLVLVHGYGSKIERGTRDVDFAINVQDWEDFFTLREKLLLNGFTGDQRVLHKLNFIDNDGLPWEIDIVPFGEIENTESTINWPPEEDFPMNVLGFKEVGEQSIKVQIEKDSDSVISVASPVGMTILKLVAWLDRPIEKRPKDADDFRYLIKSYTKIPEIYDAIFEEGYMEEQEWEEEKACAMKMGHDAALIAKTKTKQFINNELFDNDERLEMFARDMVRQNYTSLDKALQWLTIYGDEFKK